MYFHHCHFTDYHGHFTDYGKSKDFSFQGVYNLDTTSHAAWEYCVRFRYPEAVCRMGWALEPGRRGLMYWLCHLLAQAVMGNSF